MANSDDVLRLISQLAKAISKMLDDEGDEAHNIIAQLDVDLARLESQREAKAADTPVPNGAILGASHESAGASAGHGRPATGTPPPADEVSDATLRMFAATIAPDNESLRVTARAALAARADLATARRERDEAREQLGEWMCAFDALAQRHAHPALVDAAKAGAKERAALSPAAQEPKP